MRRCRWSPTLGSWSPRHSAHQLVTGAPDGLRPQQLRSVLDYYLEVGCAVPSLPVTNVPSYSAGTKGSVSLHGGGGPSYKRPDASADAESWSGLKST